MNNQLPNRCFPLKTPSKIYQILQRKHKEVSRVSMSLDRSIQRRESIVRPVKHRMVRSNPKKDTHPSLSTIRQRKYITIDGKRSSNRKDSTEKISTCNSKQYFLKKLRERPKCLDMASLEEFKVRKCMSTLEPLQLKLSQKKPIQNLDKPLNTMSSEEIIMKYGNILSNFQKSELKYYSNVYFIGEKADKTREGKANWGFDDSEGSYLFKANDHLAYRYQILSCLGEGSFGKVLQCYDHKAEREVAIKMVKNRKKYTSQAQIQIGILGEIKKGNDGANRHLVQILDTFLFRQHQCIVFQLLSVNLYQLLKLNNYQGLPQDLIRRFCLQILSGMAVLHSKKIIHCDIKPQNIVLKHRQKSGLKIIDFGSSCYFHQKIYSYLQSRYYRAPQVIVGIGYDEKIDVWSLGCVFAELFLGYPLFPGKDQNSQLAIIAQILGPPPKLFQEMCSIINPLPEQLILNNKKQKICDILKNNDFREFVKKCLSWNPQDRSSIIDLAVDPWIIKGLPPDVKSQHQSYIKQLQVKTFRKRQPSRNPRRSNKF